MTRKALMQSAEFEALYEEAVRLPSTPFGAEAWALNAMEDRRRDRVLATLNGDPYDAELPGLIADLQLFQIARMR